MRILLVLGIIGRILRIFSLAFLPPLLLALYDGMFHGGNYWEVLHYAGGGMATFAGGSLATMGSSAITVFRRSEAMCVVAGTWLAAAAFAAIPYVCDGLTPIDAIFESMSGFTTTGATILTDFGRSRAFFLWRGMTQWFGGLGVIALFVVVLPRLGIAGRQLFFAEASGAASEAISPQIHQAARRLWLLYIILTLLQTGLLVAAGMTPYDAIVNSFATLAAGGFSPNPQSIAGYQNPAAEWIFIIFMILGGTSFTLQWKAFTSKPLALVRDGEFLFYLGTCVIGGLIVAALVSGGVPDPENLRAGLFQSASLISSSGFASVDFNLWGDAPKAVLVAVMLVGGCAGSAAGGAKAVRILLVFKFLWREITRVLHPYGVIPLRYGGRLIPPEIIRAVLTLVVLYLMGYLLIGILMVVLGADLVTGFTASLACLGNIGPGYGAVGPMANYADLPLASKLLLTFGMWIGRLEIVTVLALFHPHVWMQLQLVGGKRPSVERATPLR